MKLSNPKIKDNFQKQLYIFKSLLSGSIMAKVSCFILIFFSISVLYKSQAQILEVLLLCAGILGLIYYMFKYLSIKDIKQKSYTQTSLVSSISKFKSYMKNRKKYEMYFMGFWMLSLLPYVIAFLESKSQAILVTISYIAVVYVFGKLAFMKMDKVIEKLERELETISHI